MTMISGNEWLKDFLLLNAFSCAAPGIAQGKAGMALALFALAHKSRNEKLEDRAFELLQQALVYSGKNISFSVGSAGIGFALAYSIEQQYIDADYEELYGEQHRNILQTICANRMKRKQKWESAELLLYLEMTADLISGKEEQQAKEILMEEMLEYYRGIRGKAAGTFGQEEFYRCSSLLMTLYRKQEAGERWWEEIRACCQDWQERRIICESVELGYKLMKYGKEMGNKEAMELGVGLFCQGAENRLPELMSLREQTNFLYFFSQEEEGRNIPAAGHLREQIVERFIRAEKRGLEKQIVGTVGHPAFYCGLEGGVARLLLLLAYWEELEKEETRPGLEYFFY